MMAKVDTLGISRAWEIISILAIVSVVLLNSVVYEEYYSHIVNGLWV